MSAIVIPDDPLQKQPHQQRANNVETIDIFPPPFFNGRRYR